MIDNNLMDDNYISIDDAAAYLGIKTVTLRNWIKKKPDIPAHRWGNSGSLSVLNLMNG